MPLSEKQRRFAVGIASGKKKKESAIFAGVSPDNAGKYSCKWLNNPEVCDYIRDLRKMVRCQDIADVKELQEFWTSVMRGRDSGALKMSDRLKASEYLGRANHMFDENVRLMEDLNIKIQVEYVTPNHALQPAAIDAEYEEVQDVKALNS